MNDVQKNAIREANNYLKAAGLPTYSALTQRPAAQPAGHDCVYRAEPLQPGDTNGPQTAACMTCGQPPRGLGAPPQATPEPVGEPFGWVCRYLCHADDDGEQLWTDRYFTLSSESVPPKWSRGSYAAQEAVPVFTRPASAVPEPAQHKKTNHE